MESTEKKVYEPPMLVDVGSFAEVTHGSGPIGGEFVDAIRGYWLI